MAVYQAPRNPGSSGSCWTCLATQQSDTGPYICLHSKLCTSRNLTRRAHYLNIYADSEHRHWQTAVALLVVKIGTCFGGDPRSAKLSWSIDRDATDQFITSQNLMHHHCPSGMRVYSDVKCPIDAYMPCEFNGAWRPP